MVSKKSNILENKDIDILDSQNIYLKNKNYNADLVPKNKLEMWRNITLEDSCNVKGCIFGGNLKIISGSCVINKSVFVKEDVNILMDKPGVRNKINGNLQAERSINIESNLDPASAYLVVEGDIYANNIKIENVFIYGNIFGQSITLKNAIVLGSLYAEKKIYISSSIIGTFSTRDIEIGKLVTMILPSAVSENKIELTEDLRILFFNLMDQKLKKENKDIGFTIKLTEKDIVEYNIDNAINSIGSISPKYVIGLGARAINLLGQDELIKKNADILTEKYLQNHKLNRVEKEEINWERKMFDTIKKVSDLELTGDFSIYDIDSKNIPIDTDLLVVELNQKESRTQLDENNIEEYKESEEIIKSDPENRENTEE